MSAYKGQKYKERKPLPLLGIRFGRLVVVTDLGLKQRNGGSLRSRYWLCKCDCGNETKVPTRNLTNGDSMSCGCYGAERRREASIVALTKHGHAKSGARKSEYNVFKTMHARCYNPNNKGYHRYGGRGIIVEHCWHRYENFFADIGYRPSPKHQLERRDNNGNYGPDNCYWATAKDQARNRRSNHVITINNESRCAAEWSELSGLGAATILKRVGAGWPSSRLLIPLTKGINAIHR